MKTLRLLPLLLLFTLPVHSREWTSTDGKKLDADFVSATAEQVTLKRTTDGQTFALPLSRLSPADQAWVKEQAPAAAPATPPAPATPAKAGAAAAPGKPIEGQFASLITGDWALSEFGGQKFSFYGGKNLTTAEKIPLVLTLHGRSDNADNGKQVGGWMKTLAKPDNYKDRPCFILAPLSAQPEAAQGMGWSGKEIDRVVKLIKTMVKELPIDPKRIYIAGHSMGGWGTTRIFASEPKLFAAGIMVAGCSNSDVSPLARKPIWIFHAADDDIVKVATSQDFAKMMKPNKQFKYTEYPTGGHGVVGKVFDDVETHKWLFEQK